MAILRGIFREAIADGVTGEAAKVAYYFFLSLFPMILALFAFTGILGGSEAFEWVMGNLRRALPGEAAEYLAQFVLEVTGATRPGMLSLGLLLSLWAASNAFAWLMRGLNVIYDVEEERGWVRRRAVALVALVVALALMTVSAATLLSGPTVLSWVGIEAGWRFVRWPVVWALITLAMALIYYLLPSRGRPPAKGPVLIGALVGTGLWVLATTGFRLYVAHFGSFSATYGVVGGVIVLLLWLYLTALAILFGGEVAATLEQRAAQAT